MSYSLWIRHESLQLQPKRQPPHSFQWVHCVGGLGWGKRADSQALLLEDTAALIFTLTHLRGRKSYSNCLDRQQSRTAEQNSKLMLQRSIDCCAVSWCLISLQTEFPYSYFIFSLAPVATHQHSRFFLCVVVFSQSNTWNVGFYRDCGVGGITSEKGKNPLWRTTKPNNCLAVCTVDLLNFT